MAAGDDFDPEVAEAAELDWDNQLFAVASFAFLALMGIIIVAFVGTIGLNSANYAFQFSVNNQIAAIQALLPPTQKSAERAINTLVSLGNNLFDTFEYLISQGLQSVLNVLVAVGGSLLETIDTSADFLTDLLNSVGNTTFQLFEDVFTPITNLVVQGGDSIILMISLVTTILTPTLQFIGSVISAIARVGSIF
jgi:hypothetical protein